MILATHGHYDHIAGVYPIVKKYSCPFGISSLDNRWTFASKENIPIPNYVSLEKMDIDLDEMPELPFKIEIIKTPGHSKGSVSFYIEELKTVLSGDALFAGTIGRTDLVDGDFNELIKSIKERLFVLPDDTNVIPGHGWNTSILKEKQTNPFLKSDA
jgi:glyoxylase-like metal-dependent hydrolase (beta-lactamase superfamily II)